MNFIWFGFAITYFVLFVIIFYQCTKSVLVIKMLSDAKTQEFVMEDINRIFLKKTVKEQASFRKILLYSFLPFIKQSYRIIENTSYNSKPHSNIEAKLVIYLNRKKKTKQYGNLLEAKNTKK